MTKIGPVLARAAAALLSGIVLAGCGVVADRTGAEAGAPSAPPASAGPARVPAPPDSPLAGTAWRLIEIQSSDDGAGPTSVAGPSLHTMRLMADGSVAFRLSCNTGTGTWSAEAGPDPSSGRFGFGPVAATMAECPPPGADERVLTQAPYFASYLLKDGRLYLSLLAGGGIFVWEPLDSGG